MAINKNRKGYIGYKSLKLYNISVWRKVSPSIKFEKIVDLYNCMDVLINKVTIFLNPELLSAVISQ